MSLDRVLQRTHRLVVLERVATRCPGNCLQQHGASEEQRFGSFPKASFL